MYNIHNRLSQVLTGEFYSDGGLLLDFEQAERNTYYRGLTGMFPPFLEAYDESSNHLSGITAVSTTIQSVAVSASTPLTDDQKSLVLERNRAQAEDSLRPLQDLYTSYNRYVATTEATRVMSASSNRTARSSFDVNSNNNVFPQTKSDYVSPFTFVTTMPPPQYSAAQTSFDAVNKALGAISDFGNYGAPGSTFANYQYDNSSLEENMSAAADEAFAESAAAAQDSGLFGPTDNPLLKLGVGGNAVSLDPTKLLNAVNFCGVLGNVDAFKLTISGMLGITLGSALSGDFCKRLDAAADAAFEESPYWGIFTMWSKFLKTVYKETKKEIEKVEIGSALDKAWDGVRAEMSAAATPWDSTNGQPGASLTAKEAKYNKCMEQFNNRVYREMYKKAVKKLESENTKKLMYSSINAKLMMSTNDQIAKSAEAEAKTMQQAYKGSLMLIDGKYCKFGMRVQLDHSISACKIIKMLAEEALSAAQGNINPTRMFVKVLNEIAPLDFACFQEMMDELKTAMELGSRLAGVLQNLMSSNGNWPFAVGSLTDLVMPGATLAGFNSSRTLRLMQAMENNDFKSISDIAASFLQTNAFEYDTVQYLLRAIQDYGNTGGNVQELIRNIGWFLNNEYNFQVDNSRWVADQFGQLQYDFQDSNWVKLLPDTQFIDYNPYFTRASEYYPWLDDQQRAQYRADIPPEYILIPQESRFMYYSNDQYYGTFVNPGAQGGGANQSTPPPTYSDPMHPGRSVSNLTNEQVTDLMNQNKALMTDLSVYSMIFNVDFASLPPKSRMRYLARYFSRILAIQHQGAVHWHDKLQQFSQEVRRDIIDLQNRFEFELFLRMQMPSEMFAKTMTQLGFGDPNLILADAEYFNSLSRKAWAEYDATKKVPSPDDEVPDYVKSAMDASTPPQTGPATGVFS